jgi:hypothetical protein
MKAFVSICVLAFLLLITASRVNAQSTTQGHFRWRNDDGSETGATWRKALDTNDSLKAQSNVRLRIELYNMNSSGSAVDNSLSLYYSPDGSSYTEVTTDGSVNAWKLAPSSHFTDGAGTTEPLGQFPKSAVNFGGGLMIQSSSTFGLTILYLYSYEYEFCIIPTSNAVSGTRYYFRIQGGVGSGYDRTPSIVYTSPVVTTAASAIGFTTANVNGTVNAQNVSTTVRFVYGTSSGVYPDSVDAAPLTATGNTVTSESGALTGLTQGTIYYYRVSADNSSGYLLGAEKSFTTGLPEGYALSFSASDNDKVSIASSPNIPINNSCYTIEAWIKPNSMGTNGIVGWGNYGNGDQVNALRLDGDAILNYWWGDDLDASVGDLSGVWHHVAASFDGTTRTIYLDGNIVGSDNPSGTHAVPDATNFNIGVTNFGEFFDGVIDEVRIWNWSLPQDTIQAWMIQSITPAHPDYAHLVAYFKFDEGSGIIVNDSSSAHDNVGVLVNSPAWVVADLPVELTSFTASANGLNAVLTWKTSTEINNAGFEIERTPAHPSPLTGEGQGGGSWTTVGSVAGAGTSNSPKSYSFTDKVRRAGTYSYRLKQIDHNGAFKYSQEIQVQVGAAPKVFDLSQNYPNPFNPTTAIAFTVPSDGPTTLKVYNTLGQEVATLFNNVAKAGEFHQATFDGSRLASGIYFARLESGGKQMMKKMIMVK